MGNDLVKVLLVLINKCKNIQDLNWQEIGQVFIYCQYLKDDDLVKILLALIAKCKNIQDLNWQKIGQVLVKCNSLSGNDLIIVLLALINKYTDFKDLKLLEIGQVFPRCQSLKDDDLVKVLLTLINKYENAQDLNCKEIGRVFVNFRNSTTKSLAKVLLALINKCETMQILNLQFSSLQHSFYASPTAQDFWFLQTKTLASVLIALIAKYKIMQNLNFAEVNAQFKYFKELPANDLTDVLMALIDNCASVKEFDFKKINQQFIYYQALTSEQQLTIFTAVFKKATTSEEIFLIEKSIKTQQCVLPNGWFDAMLLQFINKCIVISLSEIKNLTKLENYKKLSPAGLTQVAMILIDKLPTAEIKKLSLEQIIGHSCILPEASFINILKMFAAKKGALDAADHKAINKYQQVFNLNAARLEALLDAVMPRQLVYKRSLEYPDALITDAEDAVPVADVIVKSNDKKPGCEGM
jgi:hypothetical protein